MFIPVSFSSRKCSSVHSTQPHLHHALDTTFLNCIMVKLCQKAHTMLASPIPPTVSWLLQIVSVALSQCMSKSCQIGHVGACSHHHHVMNLLPLLQPHSTQVATQWHHSANNKQYLPQFHNRSFVPTQNFPQIMTTVTFSHIPVCFLKFLHLFLTHWCFWYSRSLFNGYGVCRSRPSILSTSFFLYMYTFYD